MNAPERTASFLLDEDNGEMKIVYTPDTKVANSGTFRFNREDHTVRLYSLKRGKTWEKNHDKCMTLSLGIVCVAS